MKEVYIRKDELNSCIAKHFKQDLISISDLISVIEDLDSEVDQLNEKIEEIENNVNENYRRISDTEMVGISNKDFI